MGCNLMHLIPRMRSALFGTLSMLNRTYKKFSFLSILSFIPFSIFQAQKPVFARVKHNKCLILAKFVDNKLFKKWVCKIYCKIS